MNAPRPFLHVDRWMHLLRAMWPAWALDEGFMLHEERGAEPYPCVVRVLHHGVLIDASACSESDAVTAALWVTSGCDEKHVPDVPLLRWIQRLPTDRFFPMVTEPSREAEDAADPTPEQQAELVCRLGLRGDPERDEWVIYLAGAVTGVVEGHYGAIYALRTTRRAVAKVIAAERSAVVPTTLARAALLWLVKEAALGPPGIALGAWRAEVNARQELLARALRMKDHLAVQVTELQTANTKLVMERRRLAWMAEGTEAAVRGVPQLENPYRLDDAAHNHWRLGHAVVCSALDKARGETVPLVDGRVTR